MRGKLTSCLSMSLAAGHSGMNVPNRNLIPSHSPPAGQSSGAAAVSGPAV